jgi:organic hydroperoxide reductase OsmC/OhrA
LEDSVSEPFRVNIDQLQNFQFLIDFNKDGVTDLVTDEPAPLGEGKGPNPARLLAAAVGNCLAASLLFCLRKARLEPLAIRAVVEGDMVRNDQGRMRIRELRVRLEPTMDPDDVQNLSRCASVFEDFCIVTESVREGIDVVVDLAPIAHSALEVCPAHS